VNRPRGAAFIRDGEKAATVKVKLNGSTIERKKGKGVNSYRVDKQTFKAFGDNVPEEVENLLNVEDINFQSQHDAPFWFSLTAGEVARQLNSIVDLEAIDEVLGRVASRLRKGRIEVDFVAGQLAESEESLKGLAFVPKFLEQYRRIKRRKQGADESRSRADSNAVLVGQAKSYQTRAKSLLDVARVASTLVLRGKKAQSIISRAGDCGRLAESARRLAEIVRQGAPDTSRLEELDGNCRKLEQRTSDILELIKSLRLIEYSRSQCTQELTVIRNRIRQEFRNRCPLCGGQLNGGR